MPTTHVPACSVSASSVSSSPSNIKIEQVLNSSSSSASIDPLSPSQSSGATTASCPLYPPQPPPPPPTPSSLLLPLSTTLHISESPTTANNQLPEYQNHKVDILPPSSSTLPEQSMAAAVAVPQPTHAMQPFTRPIRFVANDGQPHAKRRRISAAYVISCISTPLKLEMSLFQKVRMIEDRKTKITLHALPIFNSSLFLFPFFLSFFLVCLVFNHNCPSHPTRTTPREYELRGLDKRYIVLSFIGSMHLHSLE